MDDLITFLVLLEYVSVCVFIWTEFLNWDYPRKSIHSM